MIDKIKNKAKVAEQETERAQAILIERRYKDARAVLATEEGRRLMHWLIFDVGALQRLVAAEADGRRAVATALYHLVDTAQPGVVEEIALESRQQLVLDNAEIASAIAKRRAEYE